MLLQNATNLIMQFIRFMHHVFKTLLIKLEVKKVTVSVYHLETNDIIEHKHTSIMQTLLKACKNQLY